MEFKVIPGIEAAPIVDAFYEKYGQHTRARAQDTFFVLLDGSTLVASVRYCLEENTHLLRGMMIHPEYRRKGIGTRLLKEFETFLIQKGISPTYCVPHSYLESFYGGAGFKKVLTGPKFLVERVSDYNSAPNRRVILMKRD